MMFKFNAALLTATAVLTLNAGTAFAHETLVGTPMVLASLDRSSGSVATVDAEIVHPEEATYPAFERAASIGGQTTILIDLDASGALTGTSVLTSSGRKALDESATEAIRASTFRAAVVKGHPIGGKYAVTVTFDPNY